MKVAGYIGHKHSGIILYKEVWPRSAKFADRLEEALAGSTHDRYSWHQSTVGDTQLMLDYRNCSDYKIRQSELPITEKGFEDLSNIYIEVIGGVRECLQHYCSLYNNIKLEYEEATNFVRYTEGQHFSIHSDSGFSYSCAVSTIGYINDGYKGGEYVLPYFDVKFTPEMGDLIIHPSAFVYAHASLPIISGTKYSAVTMYDYNDRNHADRVQSSMADKEKLAQQILGI